MSLPLNEARRLTLVLVALAAAQFLHTLDELRSADDATLLGSLLQPQVIAGIGGSLLAAWAVRNGWPSGRFLARLSGGLVGLGFVVVHGLPWASERTEPYWGDGSADALQWLGVLVILALCAAALRLASSRSVMAAG